MAPKINQLNSYSFTLLVNTLAYFSLKTKVIFLTVCLLLVAQIANAISIKDFVRNAVSFTLNSKVESVGYRMDAPPSNSRFIVKDGQNMRFTTKISSGAWKNVIHDAKSKLGELYWYSETEDGMPIDKVAIYRDFSRTNYFLKIFEALGEKKRLNSGSYSWSKSEYKGIPCYKITIRYPTNDSTIMATNCYNLSGYTLYDLSQKDPTIYQRNIKPDEFRQNKELIRRGYFAGIQLLIDATQDRPFIYAMTAFNLDGLRIYDMEWGNVKFLDSVKPTKFSPPSGTEIIKVNNHEELSREVFKHYASTINRKNTSSWGEWPIKWLSATGDFFSRNTDAILIGGGKIAFWLAMVTAGLAIMLKIHRKKQK